MLISYQRGRRTVSATAAFNQLGKSYTTEDNSAVAVSDPGITEVTSLGWDVLFTNPPTMDPVGAPKYLLAIRQGYDTSANAVSFTDTLILTQRIRQAYPNQASLDASRVALTDYVYSTDTVTNVTNSSAETSPKPIANWVMIDRQVVGNSIHLELVAFHRDARSREAVACVIFRATDGTTTVTQTVSTTEVSSRSTDQNPVVVHQCDLDITSLNNTAVITVNAKVYPWVGAAASVLDSADQSGEREFSPRTFYKDTTLLAAPRVAYVRTTGDDGTGVVSTTPATASANPFLTVLAAINAHHTAGGLDGAVIYIGNDGGTPFVLGSTAATRTQTNVCLTITRESGVARANARVSFGLAAFRTRFPFLRFYDVGIVRTGTLYFQGEAATQMRLFLDDIDFDNASHNAAFLSQAHSYLNGVTMTNLTASPLAAATYEHRMLRGVLGTGTAPNIEAWLIVGSNFSGVGTFGRGTRTQAGSIAAFNKFPSLTLNGSYNLGSTEDVAGAAVVQNVFEYVSATENTGSRMSGDDASGDLTHIVYCNNTYVGFFNAGRSNIFYNETAADLRTHKLNAVKGNIFVSINTKHDVFQTDGTFIGGWSFLYGVACNGNFSQFIDADSGGLGSAFAQAFAGMGTLLGTSSTVRQDPLFTDYQGTTSGPTAGAGGGTYTLQGGSSADGILEEPVLRFDLAGTTRATANTAAGAYEI